MQKEKETPIIFETQADFEKAVMDVLHKKLGLYASLSRFNLHIELVEKNAEEDGDNKTIVAVHENHEL